MLTLANLQNQWPHADTFNPGLLEGMAAAAPTVFAKYGLTTPLTVAHAMAQFSVETGQGHSLIEDLKDYSVAMLLKIFPRHFTQATATQFAGNAQMVGEIAYGGRLGNAAAPSTDGFAYRGAGLIQLTGKGNVADLNTFLATHKAGIDIVANPGLLVDAKHSLECGVAMFVKSGCLPFAEKDDVTEVSLLVNGGTNGLPMRKAQLLVWKKELGIQ